jgi:D-glycero-D-manno-heptose 1,7-bisphosphate phosphatase
MQKAIFLDRDGVINKEIGDYVTSHNDFEVLEHVVPNLKKLKDAGFIFIVITNQGGIAKGLYTHDELSIIHKKMNDYLAHHQLQFTEIYYCPHHPATSNCLCRKPGSVMIEKAIAKYDINPALSFMIGDKERDVEASQAAGVKGFLIEANEDWSYLFNKIIN